LERRANLRKRLLSGLLLVLLAGCAPGPFARESSPRRDPLGETISQCGETAERVDLVGTRSGALRSEERPDYGFPNQVLFPDELYRGGLFVWCRMLTGEGMPIVLTSDPYGMESPGGTVTLLVRGYFMDDHLPEPGGEIWLLSQMGVVPYHDGKWNGASVILSPQW